jgi:2-polyprenyl-3-methyl-5-hydroxy-6-metoxy-1,4-benzoquinol methylase/NTP pyrophosphatase (non-canonical NTP hydrolase)
MNKSISFREMVELTKQAKAAFDRVEQRPWSVEANVIELMKQVGDLAKRVMVFERYYLPDRDRHPAYQTTLDNIANELADVLYCVIRLMLYYEIDLEEAFVKARRDELGYAAESARNTPSRPLLRSGLHESKRQAEALREHYENLLALRYDWMLGGSEVAESTAKDLFVRLGIARRLGGEALDLGCGTGLHAQALAERGFRVRAVDLSPSMIAQTARRCANLPVEAVERDFCDPGAFATGVRYELVVCLGDTLTHLASEADVVRLIGDVCHVLEPGGTVVLSFRDLSIERQGVERIFTVRATAERIMMTFLEYGMDHVWVNDVFQELHSDGWQTSKSRYRKLRLAPSQVVEIFAANGFELRAPERAQENDGGLTYIVAQRPAGRSSS